jgi:hypothetical protein
MNTKSYTLVASQRTQAGKPPHTTLLTALTPDEALRFYDVYANSKSLIWIKLINDESGTVWKESVGGVS